MAAAVVLIATLTPVAPLAAAEPAGGALVDAPTLPWPDLGAPAMLSFYGETSATTLSFAVPTGVVPATLNAALLVRSASMAVCWKAFCLMAAKHIRKR